MKNNSELRNLTVEELHSELLELRKDQFRLRMKKSSGTLDKQHHVTLTRKAIARVKTIMAEKVKKS